MRSALQHSAWRQFRRAAPCLEKQWHCLSCRNSLTKETSSIITQSRCFASASSNNQTPDEILSSFANLDHRRASRTGFPEAVFGQGKTPSQIHSILDSMAHNVNELVEASSENDKSVSTTSTAIIATRVDQGIYDAVLDIGPLKHGVMEYHDTARIISVRANAVEKIDDATNHDENKSRQSVVVACAGTTDLPVAEEAALTLSLSGIPVTRIYDCGVAGLHRIISALPKLRNPNVGCVIVCAGMDGALPSVVGGLVDVPVVAVPTSVGYGMSLGGMSALLTMLNSCSPGVGVVNVDNGFGGAVWAMKCLNSRQK
ncbi:hypothetical protein ACHAXR_003782 [Thalassiosira sp. AJA248-18]